MVIFFHSETDDIVFARVREPKRNINNRDHVAYCELCKHTDVCAYSILFVSLLLAIMCHSILVMLHFGYYLMWIIE